MQPWNSWGARMPFCESTRYGDSPSFMPSYHMSYLTQAAETNQTRSRWSCPLAIRLLPVPTDCCRKKTHFGHHYLLCVETQDRGQQPQNGG